MTPEITAENAPNQLPPGLTTRVVKGSIWTLAGHVAPLIATFFSTPFVIRLLGSEKYGLYILVGLIPGYLMFADFGMGYASTKFAAEAYGDGDLAREARVVRTAAFIALAVSVPVAALLFIFADPVAVMLNVPDEMRSTAIVALRIASGTFVISLLNSIFNTPQLSRLRMDLNSLVNAAPKIAGVIALPVVIWYGYGVVGAVSVLCISSVLVLAGHLAVSWRLLPHLAGLSIDRSAVRPMIRFGASLVVASIATLALGSLDKLVLVRVTSVEVLAYYSVAFALANMLTLFSLAMGQSLLPAFSQLTREDRREHLNALYARALRINVFFLLPILVMLACVAKAFFTLWAGQDFGRESPLPFYILLAGLFFNLNAYMPWGIILAFGRTDILAKNNWIQLVPYVALVVVLTRQYGAAGAATAWSIRVIADAVVLVYAARRIASLQTGVKAYVRDLVAASLMLAPPLITVFVVGNWSLWIIPIMFVSVAAYAVFVWSRIVQDDEKAWVRQVLGRWSRSAATG